MTLNELFSIQTDNNKLKSLYMELANHENFISFFAGATISFGVTFHFTKKIYGNVDNRKYSQKVKENYGEMNINDLGTIRGEFRTAISIDHKFLIQWKKLKSTVKMEIFAYNIISMCI